MQAFEQAALDYLLKPVEDARLDEALDRARTQIASRAANDNCEQLLKLLATLSQTPDLRLADVLAGEAPPRTSNSTSTRSVACRSAAWNNALRSSPAACAPCTLAG